MNDICLCGHGREAHAGGFGLCTDCKDVRKGREVSDFTCRPGACDRFTWDPKRETVPGPYATTGLGWGDPAYRRRKEGR